MYADRVWKTWPAAAEPPLCQPAASRPANPALTCAISARAAAGSGRSRGETRFRSRNTRASNGRVNQKMLGAPRQTVLQRVKRGDLEAVHVMRGKQKGLRIKVIDLQSKLLNQGS